MSPTRAPSRSGSEYHLPLAYAHGHKSVPNLTSINSAVFAQLTNMSNMYTHRPHATSVATSCAVDAAQEYYHYRPRSRGDNTFGSVRVCVRPFVCLNRLTLDLDFWHEGRP